MEIYLAYQLHDSHESSRKAKIGLKFLLNFVLVLCKSETGRARFSSKMFECIIVENAIHRLLDSLSATYMSALACRMSGMIFSQRPDGTLQHICQFIS